MEMERHDATPVHVQETIRAAREYAEAARAPNTLRAYASDIEDFSTYCRVELGGASPTAACRLLQAASLSAMPRSSSRPPG